MEDVFAASARSRCTALGSDMEHINRCNHTRPKPLHKIQCACATDAMAKPSAAMQCLTSEVVSNPKQTQGSEAAPRPVFRMPIVSGAVPNQAL